MSYPASVRYLYALGNELKIGAKFGLERMQCLMRELGSPERCGRIVHVAGTNGKGSTSAMIESAARQSGLRTGLNTSPHLVEPTERIQIGGYPVSEADFTYAFDLVHSAAERLIAQDAIDAHPSYFETVTAMAFLLFNGRCDLKIVEVGLGGRLDATNVVAPELTVITPVSFDHETFLGSTLESIAAEKAGILKPGVPVILAGQQTTAEAVIIQRADELGCTVVRTVEYLPEDVELHARGSRFKLDGFPYECALPGRHQLHNAITAILASRSLGIGSAEIAAGLRTVRWPGRLEYVREQPAFVLDGAHNPAGAIALASYIREFRGARPVWIVYGAMRDKAIEEVTAALFPLADRLILTAPDFPRALRPEAILEIYGHANPMLVPTVPAAIEIAMQAPKEALVFFTGSLYLVGETRRLLGIKEL